MRPNVLRLGGFFLGSAVLIAAGLAAPGAQPPATSGAQSTDQTGRKNSASTGTHRDRFAVVISVDGLMPASYTDPDVHGLKVPTLRGLRAAGAWSPGVAGVMPTVTYPSHTTLATGVVPGTHGITGNAVFDPLGNRDGEWFWYEEEIRVPTLWGVARGHGLRTALIGWPVTMGARADAVVPEFWRGRGIDVARLLRAISTPGLLDDVAREFPDFYAGLTPPVTKDESLADVAIHVIRHERPNLLMLHLSAVDHWQHEKGPWSPEALAAIENADGQIARVLDAAQMAGILEQTLVAIVSDHGFARQQKVLRPAVLLRQKGLITLDEKNRVKSWRAQVATSGGSAYVYVKDASDAEAQNAVMELFRGLSGQPGSGIARVFTREQIAALGGDPEAFLAIEAAEGFGFILGASGDAVADATVPGLHGFPSDREDMRSSLILRGPEVGAGRIEGVRMVDVAPTVARWLGLRLEKAEGKPLVLPARAKSSREKPLEQKRDPTPK